MSYGELMTALQTQSVLNVNRDEKAHPDPIRLPMPWPEGTGKHADVTPEERAALRAQLLRRSAFAS